MLKLKADYSVKEIKDFQALKEATSQSEQVSIANTLKDTDRSSRKERSKANKLAEEFAVLDAEHAVPKALPADA